MRITLRRLTVIAVGFLLGGGAVLSASADSPEALGDLIGPPRIFCDPGEKLVATTYLYSDDKDGDYLTPTADVEVAIADAVRNSADALNLKAPASFGDLSGETYVSGDVDSRDGASVRTRWVVEKTKTGGYRVHELYVCEGEFKEEVSG